MSQHRNIILIADELAIGHIATFTLNLARSLAEAGDRVTLITDRVRMPDARNLTHVRLVELMGLRGPLFFLARQRAKREVEEIQPGLILYVQCRHFQFLRSYHVKHQTPGFYAVLNILNHSHVRLSLPQKSESAFPTQIITVSDALRESLVNDFHVRKDHIHLVKAGIDINKFRIKKISPPDVRKVVGTVGHLIKEKGHEFFLHAAQIIKRNYPNVVFVMAGKGDQKHTLKRLVNELGLVEDVVFVDETVHTPDLLNSMDIFVVPSVIEGLGFAILEAMGCGLPVVASNVGGIYTLVKDNENGYLVPPRHAEALAERVIALLEDDDLRHEFSQNARKFIEDTHAFAPFSESVHHIMDSVEHHPVGV